MWNGNETVRQREHHYGGSEFRQVLHKDACSVVRDSDLHVSISHGKICVSKLMRHSRIEQHLKVLPKKH